MMPARDYRLPTNAGVVNVKSAPYNAVGNGIADDTTAIYNAVYDGCRLNMHVYLPKGTYKLTDQIWPKKANGNPSHNWRMFGENRDETIIKLADGATGFGDAAAPKSFLKWNSDSTAATPSTGYLTNGEGNEAYNNYLEHITVDGGANSGAITVDYIASNAGAIRDVKIKGFGFCGLNMVRNWPGPLLIQDVRVEGHDYGVRVDQNQYSVILERIELQGQNIAGIQPTRNMVGIRGLTSVNSVPAIQTTSISPNGMVTLVDASLTGGASTNPAIDNVSGELFVRNVISSGYSSLIKNKGTAVAGESQTEWHSRATSKLFTEAPDVSLNLLVEDPTEYYNLDFTQWANVVDYGATASGGSVDAGPGIQAAMNSGKPVVYFPVNTYHSAQTIDIPPTVRKVVFNSSQLFPKSASGFTDAANPKVLLRANNTQSLELSRGRVARNIELSPGLVALEIAGSGDVFLKDMNCTSRENATNGIRTKPGLQSVGKLFIENTIVTGLTLGVKGQKVFARQLNGEVNGLKMTAVGSKIWCLGFKTEGSGAVLVLSEQGVFELLAGFFYSTVASPAGTKAFTSNYSTMSLNYIEAANTGTQWTNHVEETSYASGSSSTRTQTSGAATLFPRGFGRLEALYTSVDNGSNPPPAQYALVYPSPLETTYTGTDCIITFQVEFGSQGKIDFSTIKLTLSPGDSQATTLSKMQAALVAEATRLNVTVIASNMLLPALNKGV